MTNPNHEVERWTRYFCKKHGPVPRSATRLGLYEPAGGRLECSYCALDETHVPVFVEEIEVVRRSDWEQVRDERDQGARYVEGWQEATKEAEAERDQAKAQALAEVRERINALLPPPELTSGELVTSKDDAILLEKDEVLSTLEGTQGET